MARKKRYSEGSEGYGKDLFEFFDDLDANELKELNELKTELNPVKRIELVGRLRRKSRERKGVKSKRLDNLERLKIIREEVLEVYRTSKGPSQADIKRMGKARERELAKRKPKRGRGRPKKAKKPLTYREIIEKAAKMQGKSKKVGTFEKVLLKPKKRKLTKAQKAKRQKTDEGIIEHKKRQQQLGRSEYKEMARLTAEELIEMQEILKQYKLAERLAEGRRVAAAKRKAAKIAKPVKVKKKKKTRKMKKRKRR